MLYLINVSYLSSKKTFGKGLMFYILVIGVIIVFQDSYKKIDIISAKQLNVRLPVNQQLSDF